MSQNVSIVVPTRNRGYTLLQVGDSFFSQAQVDEVIFVDDAGSDDTASVVESFGRKYPQVRTVYRRNSERRGAAYSRLEGVKAASNEYVLFCDDDQFLGPGYAQVCWRKMLEQGVSIVSGRKLYRLPGESVEVAIRRFGSGLLRQKAFETLRFQVNTEALFEGDIEIPFTHDAYLARRSLLLGYGMDPFYAKGNGFREESDVQMRAFLDGHRILVTNDAHAVHFHLSEVRSGGQRIDRIERYYWTVYYTAYFFRKYYDRARERLAIPYSRTVAISLFAAAEFYRFFFRPFFILPQRLLRRWSQ